MRSPTQTFGDVLVVHEGPDRVRWQPVGAGALQTPVGLWPSFAEREELKARLGRRDPVLVVLPYQDSAVYLLPEEASGAPMTVYGLMRRDSNLYELRVPALDWLPRPLARRGQEFLASRAAWAAGVPRTALPPLLVEGGLDGLQGTDMPDAAGHTSGPEAEQDHVRFAWRTSSAALAPGAFEELAARVFPKPAAPAADPLVALAESMITKRPRRPSLTGAPS